MSNSCKSTDIVTGKEVRGFFHASRAGFFILVLGAEVYRIKGKGDKPQLIGKLNSKNGSVSIDESATKPLIAICAYGDLWLYDFENDTLKNAEAVVSGLGANLEVPYEKTS